MKLTKEWITGFVDGDGCFSISKTPIPGSLSHFFYISQDQKSVDVLYALKKEFGCGSVYKAGGTMYNYTVTHSEHLRDKIIPHFLAYPLQTSKRITFYHWVNSLWESMERRGKKAGTLVPELEEYKVFSMKTLTPGWFRGFVDAEGCFYASVVKGCAMRRFIIGAKAEDKDLIHRCHALIQCGTLHTRKKAGFETLQVTSLDDLEKKLIPFFETRGSGVLLRTKKRIAFQKFRKIVRFMVEKRHLSPEGRAQIQKYVSALSKENRPLMSSIHSVVEDIVQSDC